MIAILQSRKTKNFLQILALAEQLEKELAWVPECINGMDRIVEFFKITSAAQDRFEGLLPDSVYRDKVKAAFVSAVGQFLNNAGRCEYGWNRTKFGEEPNEHTTFINMKVPYDELFFTKTVATHLANRNEPPGKVDYALKEEAKGKWNETGLIEADFVNPFMRNNYKTLQEALKTYRAKK